MWACLTRSCGNFSPQTAAYPAAAVSNEGPIRREILVTRASQVEKVYQASYICPAYTHQEEKGIETNDRA